MRDINILEGLQTLHIQFSPFQFLFAFLNSSRFSQFLMCPGSVFQILEPSEVKLFFQKLFGLVLVFLSYVVVERLMICLMYKV